MTPFHVGMKVVCVDASTDHKYGTPPYPTVPNHLDGLAVGVVYTIARVGPDPMHKIPCVWLVEIKRACGFAIQRFRPAHENRMDELRSLLAPVPSKELVQS